MIRNRSIARGVQTGLYAAGLLCIHILLTSDFHAVQNIAIGVAAVLGGLVLYKVIKNDDSVSPICLQPVFLNANTFLQIHIVQGLHNSTGQHPCQYFRSKVVGISSKRLHACRLRELPAT